MGEFICRRIAGEYLLRTQNTDYISHAYYWGAVFSSTNLPSACLVNTSLLSHNGTTAWSVKQNFEKQKKTKKKLFWKRNPKTHAPLYWRQPLKMWSISLMTNRDGTIISLTEQLALFKYRFNTHRDPPWRLPLLKASVVSRTLLRLTPANVCYEHMRGTCGVHASLWVNVKHGDNLRTLGGAMTAQSKVLHLLLSQSDNSKIERRITRSVFVSFSKCWIENNPHLRASTHLSVSPLSMLWTGYWFSMLSTTCYRWINHRLKFSLSESQGTYAVLLALSHSKYRTRSKGCSFVLTEHLLDTGHS